MTQSFIDIQETQRYDEVGGGSHVSKIQKLQLAATQTDKMGPRMRGTFTRREEKGDDYDMSRIVDSHSFINEQLPHSFQENNFCKNLRPIQVSTTKFLSVNCPLNNEKKLNRCCHIISKVHSLRKLGWLEPKLAPGEFSGLSKSLLPSYFTIFSPGSFFTLHKKKWALLKASHRSS